MDSRIALAANTQLHFQNKEGGAVRYTIIKEIGRGGSCIVYDASYETNTGDIKYVRIKECYPVKVRIERAPDGQLTAHPSDDGQFEAVKSKFRSDFSLGNGLFYAEGGLYDALTTTIDIYSGNGTSYLVSTYSPEFTLATYRPENLRTCVALVKQVAQILSRIHNEGYLYLDTKPDNVLVLDSYATRVQLFDLDSLIPMDSKSQNASVDPRNVRVSFSKGFAPIELQMGKVKKLGRHTDVYGVGALLFYLLFGTTPTAADCESDATFDFSTSIYAAEEHQDKLYFALTDFFHNALANFCLDRYPDMEQVISALAAVEALADPSKPYIKSSTVTVSTKIVGRQHDLQSLAAWLEDENSPCVFVTGMGGIGKSTLVRAFLAQQAESIDNLLYLTFSGSIPRTLIDDTAACIHSVEKNEKETLTEYYNRKLRAFRGLIADTKSVLVIDNYSGEINQDLADIVAVGWKVILISRKSPVADTYTEIPVGALTERADLYRLFEHNLDSRLLPTDYEYIDNIISKVNGHTLILELIAKQISSSYLSICEASDLVDNHGFSAMAPEKVIYRKDADAYPETLRNIITALFEADNLSEQMRDLLKVMSLVDSNGIDIRLLHDVLCIDSKDDANTLIRDGWMNLCDKVISLHPVIQETVHCWEWSDEAKAHAIKLMEFLFRELKAEEHREDYPQKLLWFMEASQDSFEKHPRLKKWFDRFTESQGYIGETVRQRYERCEDWSPADHKKIAFYVRLSEGILDNCKREPVLLEENIYYDLLYRAVINMPRHREDFILVRAEELLGSPRSQNGFTIMKLYDCILSIYQERKDFDTAEAKLREAEKAAKKFGHNYVWAQYYNLLSAFYDHALGGAYDAIEADEELLLTKMVDATDKTIRYARKSHRPGSKHLLAENLLTKATMLMRSEPDRKKQIDKLIAEAEKIVFAETQPYAQVRCIYYMVKAWYATLIVPSFADTLVYLSKAEEISKRITPTDLDEIDNMIIPCADMMCIWERYSYSAEFLMDGIKICEHKEDSVPYIRKKMELYRCLLDVCYEWGKQELCRSIIAEIDDGNRKYESVGIYVEIPEELRSLLFSDESIN